MSHLTERERQIIKTFAKVIPKLSEEKKIYLLGLGDGMALKADDVQNKRKE